MRARFPALLRTSFALAVAAFLWSCEEPIELNLEQQKSRLVINSNFFPGEPVRLRVSATRPAGTMAVPVTNAQVFLYEGNEMAEELVFVPSTNDQTSGSYQTIDFRPQVGQSYTVHVSAEGFDPVTAVSSIPAPVPITSLSIADLSIERTDEELVYDYHLLVDYADPEEVGNYYDLRIYQRVTPYRVTAVGDTVLQQSYLKTVGTPTHQAEQSKTISVLLQDLGRGAPVRIHLQSRIDPSREFIGAVVAELRTVSPEYFFFQRSLGPDLSGVSSGLYEPLILFNNVESGLGIFAGYTSVALDLQLVAPL
ncbi:hypothetical protein LEM8419_01349 [Neolewinella maritima]|uniref:DUF4249 domain-containing protein n=1 Tax=Neolewinella maritima TaxID=1383882 RepID=A0ABM9B099_9BACT|nr:DUF4249 domain-containing protein [Neolewinella maritima]CAH1000201.1 hypothetical protein LEM8419_01349 [Neolewinella maritima]